MQSGVKVFKFALLFVLYGSVLIGLIYQDFVAVFLFIISIIYVHRQKFVITSFLSEGREKHEKI